MGTARITASHCAVSASEKNFVLSGFCSCEKIRTITLGTKRSKSVHASAPNEPYPMIPTVLSSMRGLYYFQRNFSILSVPNKKAERVGIPIPLFCLHSSSGKNPTSDGLNEY